MCILGRVNGRDGSSHYLFYCAAGERKMGFGPSTRLVSSAEVVLGFGLGLWIGLGFGLVLGLGLQGN